MADRNDTTGMLAGTGKADITLRTEGVWADVLTEKVKAHIPPDYLEKRIIVDDPLYVRALVLDDGRQKVVLVTMDVTAIAARTISQNILNDSADDFMPRLRGRIEQELGIPGEHVNVSASHAHQVPRMLCDDEAQVDRTVDAIRQALQNRAPVTIGIGSGHETSLTFNRTVMMKDGSDYTIRGSNPPPPDDEVAGLRPIDPEIGVIRIDRLDGRPLAVVYNFASHLLLGSPKASVGHITADHVGVTRRYLEENLGGDVMAFFLQGAHGDVSEVSTKNVDQPRSARSFGMALGQRVLEAHRTIGAGPATLSVVTKTVALPLRTDIPDVIAALEQEQSELMASLRYTSLNFKAFLPLYLKHALSPDYPSHWAYRYMQAETADPADIAAMDARNRTAVEKYLASIRTMERMARNVDKIATLRKHQEIIATLGSPTVSAEIQGIRIGDSLLITAPMEVLSEVGLNVKQASPFAHTYIVSLANGYFHYSPPATYYPRGGYEVTECLLGPAWEAVFMEAMEAIFAAL